MTFIYIKTVSQEGRNSRPLSLAAPEAQTLRFVIWCGIYSGTISAVESKVKYTLLVRGDTHCDI